MVGMMDRDTVFLPQQAPGQSCGFPLQRNPQGIGLLCIPADLLHAIEKSPEIPAVRRRNFCFIVYTLVMNIQQGAYRPVLLRDRQRERFGKVQEVLCIGPIGSERRNPCIYSSALGS